jgi:hypothetical protein
VGETHGSAGGRGLTWSRVHRSGADPQRVLLVGDRSFVDPEDPAGSGLADRIADRISARTGRGLDLDVVSDLGPALQAVGAATQAWRLWRYDAVVVLVKEVEPHASGRWRSARVVRVAHRVVPELAEASRVLVVRLLPSTEAEPAACAPWSRAGADAVEDLVTSMTVPLAPGGRMEQGSAQANGIADLVIRLLHTAAERARAAADQSPPAVPATARPQAEDRTTEVVGGRTSHLERVVLLARNTFGVPFAQVNALDHGRVRTLAFVGASGEDAGDQPACTLPAVGSGPTIIGDTWRDRRLDGDPHVHGTARPVRFYAAHPLLSMSGTRVGTLCVFDFRPHDVLDIDPTVLGDLALLAEAEISTLQLG